MAVRNKSKSPVGEGSKIQDFRKNPKFDFRKNPRFSRKSEICAKIEDFCENSRFLRIFEGCRTQSGFTQKAFRASREPLECTGSLPGHSSRSWNEIKLARNFAESWYFRRPMVSRMQWGILHSLAFLTGERLYESSRAVNNGWRFTARTKFPNAHAALLLTWCAQVTRRAFLSLTVLIMCNTMPEEIFDSWTLPFRMTLFTCFSKHTVKPPRR